MQVDAIEQRPRDPATVPGPNELRTLGDQVRKRRLDLGWTQEEAARWFGVTESTIWNWESGWTTPVPLLRSAIQIFLGEDSAENPFPERLRQLRWRMRITQKELASRVGVSRSTVEDWETGRCRPRPKFENALRKLLQVQNDSLASGRPSCGECKPNP